MADSPSLYHATVRADWEARTPTHYEPGGYATEGFVHFSSAEQLVDTLHRHYPGHGDLVLLTVDPTALDTAAIWEDLYGSGTEFPHVYDLINLTAVTEVVPLPCDEHGRFDWWRPGEPVVVHRTGAATATINELLQHLSDGGFTGCPTPLWQRDGLTAVTYLVGESAGYPLPEWLRETEPLEAFGALLRATHDGSEGFRPTGPWAAGDIEFEPGWVVTHSDVGPGNIVWRGGEPVGLIDWEFAEPGPREYDLVDAAMNLCGHVHPSKHERAGLLGLDINARLSAFASGYGATSASELRTVAPDVMTQRVSDYRVRVDAGIPRWQELEAADVGNRMEASLGFLRESAAAKKG